MSNKRGNSEGSIRKRPGEDRWEARYVDAEGKRRSLYGKTRQEAARRLTTALRDREQGVEVFGDRQTVGEYLSSWLAAEQYKVRARAYQRYEITVRLHLIPGLGKLALSKLTASHIGAFHAQKMAHGCTVNTIQHNHRVLSAALEDAFRQGVVQRNVARMMDTPRVKRSQMKVYNQEQVQSLLAAVAGDRLEALCVLVLATGMRQGEALALTWSDVAFLEGSLQVNATLQPAGGGWVREETKTAHSRRRIALAQIALDALRQHHMRQAAERTHLAEAWFDMDLVFPNTVGRPISAHWLRDRWWPRLLKKAGLPYIRFHDLRHTAATLLLSRGVNVKVVSEMLGHAHIGITLGTYGHVLPHMQQHAVDTIEAVLRGQ